VKTIVSGHEHLTAALLRVMYDPLAYAAPDTHEARQGTGPVAWENQRFIERHRLVCRIDFPIDAESGWWIEHWTLLRRIAFLVGCRCLRDILAAERRLLNLDTAARRFALLPIAAPRAGVKLSQSRRVDDALLHAQGFRLIDEIAQGLPYALRQRLALMFHDVEGLSRDRAISRPSAPYPMLISTASHYAQAYPN
jgi:type III secretion system OrgA/MxiK family protein